jgi:biotin-(acetyl-CoA carboxylase) ligase
MEMLLDGIRISMERWYQLLAAGSEKLIMDAYTQSLYQLGVNARYRSSKGDFEGRIRDVRMSGELEIESGEGDILTFGFKEVEYLGIIPPDQN